MFYKQCYCTQSGPVQTQTAQISGHAVTILPVKQPQHSLVYSPRIVLAHVHYTNQDVIHDTMSASLRLLGGICLKGTIFASSAQPLRRQFFLHSSNRRKEQAELYTQPFVMGMCACGAWLVISGGMPLIGSSRFFFALLETAAPYVLLKLLVRHSTHVSPTLPFHVFS